MFQTTAPPNKTLTLGSNLTAPASRLDGDPGPRTLAPFIQLSDVDRFWPFGQWHLWQPCAQAGAQFNLSRSVHPSLTSAFFPVNIGYDVNDDVTFQFGAGLTFTLDLSNGQFTPAATFGLSIKFGRPKK